MHAPCAVTQARTRGVSPSLLSLLYILTFLVWVVTATSPKELRGWYMYAFAAETFVICGMFALGQTAPAP